MRSCWPTACHCMALAVISSVCCKSRHSIWGRSRSSRAPRPRCMDPRLWAVSSTWSRDGHARAREALFNLTSQRGADATLWYAAEPARGWSWTLLSGYHGQRRSDLDDDDWTDLPSFSRAAVRPRVFYESGTGTSVFITGGFIGENRSGGSLVEADPLERLANGGETPAGFVEDLHTRRADGGALVRWLMGDKVLTARGSFARLGQDRTFGLVRASTFIANMELSTVRASRCWSGRPPIGPLVCRWAAGRLHRRHLRRKRTRPAWRGWRL